MLVVMDSQAGEAAIAAVIAAIRDMGLTPHPLPGPTRTAIGITGNTQAIDPGTLEILPGVKELIRVTKPYKLASREMHPADTTVKTPQTVIGPGTFTIIAGPCSVENESMILRTAGPSLTTSYPPTVAVPAVGGSKVVSMCTVVDLPAPFGPRKP